MTRNCMHVRPQVQYHVPIVRRQEKGRRLVWHAWTLPVFAIAVDLDVVVQNAFDKVQEPFPDNREGMARDDLNLGDAVYRGSCLGLWRLQNLVGHLNHLRDDQRPVLQRFRRYDSDLRPSRMSPNLIIAIRVGPWVQLDNA